MSSTLSPHINVLINIVSWVHSCFQVYLSSLYVNKNSTNYTRNHPFIKWNKSEQITTMNDRDLRSVRKLFWCLVKNLISDFYFSSHSRSRDFIASPSLSLSLCRHNNFFWHFFPMQLFDIDYTVRTAKNSNEQNLSSSRSFESLLDKERYERYVIHLESFTFHV